MIIKALCGHECHAPPYTLKPPESCRDCKGKERWEGIVRSEAHNEKTERLPVPGGWLYRTQVKGPAGNGTYASRVAMVFVPEVTE